MEIDGSVWLDDDSVVEEIFLEFNSLIDDNQSGLDGILNVLGFQVGNGHIWRAEEERSGRGDAARFLVVAFRIWTTDAENGRLIGQTTGRLFN